MQILEKMAVPQERPTCGAAARQEEIGDAQNLEKSNQPAFRSGRKLKYTLRHRFAMAHSSGPYRSYDRSWEEIERMLEVAEERVIEWQDWFETCREEGDREGMKEAARNYKALQGVVKCLKWVLGEEGISNPLE